MIGVIPGANEIRAVEEFFQLFKTPWEIFNPDRSYDVVIVTDQETPEVDARLVLVFGAQLKISDKQAGLAARFRLRNARLRYRGANLPLYGETLAFDAGHNKVVCKTVAGAEVGLELNCHGQRLVRLGYDLFQEIKFLLAVGQPPENAQFPTIELHIGMLRDLILETGIPLVEIPPSPAGHDFMACLTHDIDFVGIRRHKFDHTMWGFLFRSTFGASRDFLRRKISFDRLIKCWAAAVSLPFVQLGWMKDFWIPFDWYLKVEKGLSPTFFIIPFKNRRGENVSCRHAARRATVYDIGDIPEWTAKLIAEGCEVGVHGIDAWHSVAKGREELKRVAGFAGRSDLGNRMHWLLRDENTYRVLEESGYAYDSTAGYNETAGYRCGTSQVFRPLDARTLLELPLHIQDGALFFAGRMGLSEAQAWQTCEGLVENARKFGGVLTLLWHDRSHGPERFWGDFYAKLVERLRSLEVWFGSAGQVVSWFRKRREVGFERMEAEVGSTRVQLRGGQRVDPPLRIRVHSPTLPRAGAEAASERIQRFVDFSWDGSAPVELGRLAKRASETAPEALALPVGA